MSIAICTRNRAALMGQAVESVLGQLDGTTEVLVVDNASTDRTPAIVRELAARDGAVVMVREEQLGLSTARNTALRRARGRYVIFLDDDATAEPGWLMAYRTCFAAPPCARLGAVGGGVSPRWERLPPRWMQRSENMLDAGAEPRRFEGRAGPWGCNFAVDRALSLSLGGFNSALGRTGQFLGAHEESELFQRMAAAGYEIWWLPGARIRHFVAAERTRFGWNFRKEFQQGRSAALVRLSARRKTGRVCYAAGRLLAAPLEMALSLGVALVTSPFQHQRRAARALLHLARTAGFARQLLARSRE